MKHIISLFLIICTHIYGFSQAKTNAVITGKFTDGVSKPISITTVIDYAGLERPISYQAEINSDHTFIIRFYVPKTGRVQFVSDFMYCEPGDSVNVEISGNLPFLNMAFTGRRAYQYNYFIEDRNLKMVLNKTYFNKPEQSSNDGSSLIPFKEKLNEQYGKRFALFNKYNSQYPCSNGFKDFAYSQVYYEYLYELAMKYQEVKQVDEKLTEDYFKGITPSKMQNEKYINSFSYGLGMSVLLQRYWAKANDDETIATVLGKQFKFVKEQFSGGTKDLLLAKLFRYYFERANPEYKSVILEEYENSRFVFKNKAYYQKLIPFHNRYTMFDLFLDKDSKTMLSSTNGKDILLSELIQSLKGNVIYVDFWASWCGPCREQMPYSDKLQKELAGKPVKFIYLSNDDNKVNWQKAFEELKMNDSNSFLISASTKEEFSKRINLTSIPRYVLINKEGKIVDGDASIPSDSALRMKIYELLQ